MYRYLVKDNRLNIIAVYLSHDILNGVNGDGYYHISEDGYNFLIFAEQVPEEDGKLFYSGVLPEWKTPVEPIINHNNLLNIFGGETDGYYHLKEVEYNWLVDGYNNNWLENKGGTGEESFNNGDLLIGDGVGLDVLEKGGEGAVLKIESGNVIWDDVLFSSEHNDLFNLLGGNTSERYHFKQDEHNWLVDGYNNNWLESKGGTGEESFNEGDLLIGDGVGLSVLPKGVNNEVLKVISGDIVWDDLSGEEYHNNFNNLQGGTEIDGYYHLEEVEHSWLVDGYNNNWLENKGGTGEESFNEGDLLIGDGTGLSVLSKGNEDEVLKVVGGNVTWDGLSFETDHNNYGSINGGTSGEYYHLTSHEHVWLLDGYTDGYWKENKGGTGNTIYNEGDLLVGNEDEGLSKLSTINDGYNHCLGVDFDIINQVNWLPNYYHSIFFGKLGMLPSNYDGYLVTSLDILSGEFFPVFIVPFDSKLSNLWVRSSQGPGDGYFVDIIVRKNNEDTGLIVNMSNNEVIGYNTTNNIYAVKDDVITIRVNSSAYSNVQNLCGSLILENQFKQPDGLFSFYSIRFDGGTEYIQMGDVLGYSSSDPLSISYWFKAVASSASGYLISKAAVGVYGYGVYHNSKSDGTFDFRFMHTGGNELRLTSSKQVNDLNWHHILITYDGSKKASGVNFYVDGVLDLSPTVDWDSLTGNSLNSASFNISGRTNGSFPANNCILDEVSVWDKELSSVEGLEIYNSGIPKDLDLHSANNYLAGWWRMGDGDTFPAIKDYGHGGLPFGLVRDVSGNNYNANMVSMEQSDIQTDVPFGKAVLFDGSNDYVTMGNVLGFERTDAFSVGFWIKAPYSATGYHQLIGKQESSGNYRGWSVQLEKSTGILRLVLRSVISTNEIVVRTDNVTNDVWRYVMFTYDGSSQASGVNVYVDGVSGGTITSDTLTGTITNSVVFMLGSMNAAGDWYLGHLDEVTIWDKELSSNEAALLYNNGRLPVNPKNLSFASNLVGWWTMGDGDVYPTLKDYSNNSYNGTMTGMAVSSIVDRNFGRSILFDGIDDYITMGNLFDFERTNSFSIGCWVKYSSTSAMSIISKMTGANYQGYNILLNFGRIYFELLNSYSSNWLSVYTNLLFNDSRWHYIVCTYDGSSTAVGCKIYVDGKERELTIFSNTLSATIRTTASFQFGRRAGTSFLLPYSGELDEITVWDKTLSNIEVSELYNNGRLPVKPTEVSFSGNLIGWWPLGEGSVAPNAIDQRVLGFSSVYPTILDVSGNGYTGTMTNMGIEDIILDSPGGTFSKFSLDFDGSNDYINVGNVLGFERTDAFSISCWVKTTGVSNGCVCGKFYGVTTTGYALIIDSTGKPYVDIMSSFGGNNFIQIGTTSATVNNGSWRHLVITYDGSSDASGVNFYIDNVLITSLTVYNNTLTNSISNSANFSIGMRGGDYPLNGRLSDVSIFNKELSSIEVENIYNDGIPLDNRQLSFSSNLVGYWLMGDQVRFDGTMTNMNLATCIKDRLIVPDEAFSKGSLIFDGGEYINCGNILNYEYNNSFSINFWIKTTTTTNSQIVSKMAGATTYRGYATYLYGSTGKYSFFLNHSSVTTTRIDVETTTVTINDGRWHHIISTYNGSGLASGIKVYIDGNEVALSITNDNLGSNTIVHSTNLNIAARTNGSIQLNGSIDEVAFYNKVLSLSEVIEIYNQGIPNDLRLLSTGGNLDAYWRLGDSTPNNGVMTNMLATNIVEDSSK